MLVANGGDDVEKHVLSLVWEEGLEVLNDLGLGEVLPEDLNFSLNDLDDSLTDYNYLPYIYSQSLKKGFVIFAGDESVHGHLVRRSHEGLGPAGGLIHAR